jgi:hypothetical protein
MTVYGCTTTSCSERFRGFTDEPTFCSICMEDLTPFPDDGRTLDEMNEFAGAAPRPMPEVEETW